MRSEWFDAIASLLAFTKASKASPEAINGFGEILIRLASMMRLSVIPLFHCFVLFSASTFLIRMGLRDLIGNGIYKQGFLSECDRLA